jgi:hypothetical protein
MTIEAAAKKVFGKTEGTRDELYKLFSFLLDLLEEFISQQEFKKTTEEKKHKILYFLAYKGIEPLFRSELEKSRKRAAQNPLRNEAYYHNNFMLHHIDYDNATLRKSENQLELAILNNQALNLMLIYQKLTYYNQLTIQQVRSSSQVSDDILMESIINSEALLPEDLQLQANIYKMLKTPSIELYESNLIELDKLKVHFDSYQLGDIISYFAQVLLILKLPSQMYHQKLLLLYKWRVRNNLLLTEGFIVPFSFRNIILVSISCKELVFAKSFHEKYVHLIFTPFQEKNNMMDYTAAMILFAEGNYEAALTKCNLIYAQNIEFKMDERVLRIKIYYELAYFDLFEDSINNYRKFLSENQEDILERTLVGMRNFTNFTHRIFRTNSVDDAALRKIQAEIETLNFLPEKVWLLEKVEEKMKK